MKWGVGHFVPVFCLSGLAMEIWHLARNMGFRLSTPIQCFVWVKEKSKQSSQSFIRQGDQKFCQLASTFEAQHGEKLIEWHGVGFRMAAN
jgi:hypothetical protein